MITNIQIKNFKSLKKIEVALGQITILIGLNGSGKSSLIHVLGVLKQSSSHPQSQILFDGELLNLGNFNEVVSKGENRISFIIGGKKEVDFAPFIQHRTIAEYGFGIVCDSNGIINLEPEIKVGNYFIGGRWATRTEENPAPKKIEIDDASFQYNIAPIVGNPLNIHSGSVGTNREKYEEAQTALTRLFGIFQGEFKSVAIVPAERGLDLPQYSLENSPHEDIIDSKGSSLQASHLASTIAYTSEIEEKVSNYIRRITSISIRHKLVPNMQVRIETRNGINIINEGFGSNQLVHLFTQIESALPYSLIAIEEPEIHLHPRAQAEMAQVLMEIAQKDNKNLLISTHSEHLLFRFLTNVAKGKLDPKDLVIYYFELEKGFSKVTKLDVDKNGRLSGGLKGFFETDLDEFARFLGA